MTCRSSHMWRDWLVRGLAFVSLAFWCGSAAAQTPRGAGAAHENGGPPWERGRHGQERRRHGGRRRDSHRSERRERSAIHLADQRPGPVLVRGSAGGQVRRLDFVRRLGRLHTAWCGRCRRPDADARHQIGSRHCGSRCRGRASGAPATDCHARTSPRGSGVDRGALRSGNSRASRGSVRGPGWQRTR